MYSSEDLERFYFQYQTEAMPKGISIEQFCSRNKVPYNIFYKWYKDTRNKIVEVKVDGLSCLGSGIAEAGKPFSETIFYSRDIQLIPTLYFLKTAKYQIVLREK